MRDDSDHQRPCLVLYDGCKSLREIAVASSFHDDDLPAHRIRHLHYVARLVLELQSRWTAREVGDCLGLGNQLAQQIKPLAREVSGNSGHARDVAAWPVQTGGKAVLHRV